MRAHDEHALTLPPQAVANPEFPYEPQLDSARRFLADRGITEVQPLYRRTRIQRAARPGRVRGTPWPPERRSA